MLTLAFLLGALPARADGADEVFVLTPPPVPALTNPTPVLERGPDLSPYLNQVVLGVDVVIPPEQRALWPDVKVPSIGVLKAGDILTHELVRGAMQEVLATGAFADARAELKPEGAGVRVTIVVTPRKVIHRSIPTSCSAISISRPTASSSRATSPASTRGSRRSSSGTAFLRRASR